MNQSEESQEEKSILPFFVNALTEDRGQTQLCQN